MFSESCPQECLAPHHKCQSRLRPLHRQHARLGSTDHYGQGFGFARSCSSGCFSKITLSDIVQHYRDTNRFSRAPNGLRFSRREASAASEAVGWKRWLASAPFHSTSTVTTQLEPHTWQYWGLHLPAQRLQPSLEQPEDGQKGLCDELANSPLPARAPA